MVDPTTDEKKTDVFLAGAIPGGKAVKFNAADLDAVILVPKGAMPSGTEYPMPGGLGASQLADEVKKLTDQNAAVKTELSSTKDQITKLSDELKKAQDSVRLSTEEMKKTVDVNAQLSKELGEIRKAEIDQVVTQIVDVRLSKGLVDEKQVADTKVALSKLPIDQLRVLLSDMDKIKDKIPQAGEPKANSTVQLSEEKAVRLKMFGHEDPITKEAGK